MANKNAVVGAFKVFRDFSRVRESLHINFNLWGKLSEEIQAEISAIKEEPKPPDRKETPKLKPIQAQYGLNRIAKKPAKEYN